MRTETELAPLKLAEFKAMSGYLEQVTRSSWERLVQSEMTLRGWTAHPLDTRVTMAGVILSSMSAITLVLAGIYRHLDGAITGQVQGATALQWYLIAGIIVGLGLAVVAESVPDFVRSRRQPAHHRHRAIRD